MQESSNKQLSFQSKRPKSGLGERCEISCGDDLTETHISHSKNNCPPHFLLKTLPHLLQKCHTNKSYFLPQVVLPDIHTYIHTVDTHIPNIHACFCWCYENTVEYNGLQRPIECLTLDYAYLRIHIKRGRVIVIVFRDKYKYTTTIHGVFWHLYF